MNMLAPIVIVVGMKDCVQTNYGEVVKFVAVLSFMCVKFLLVYTYFNTKVHCLPTNYGKCKSYCNVCAKDVFCGVFPKGDVYTNFTMPIFCVSPNSIMSPSFIYFD